MLVQIMKLETKVNRNTLREILKFSVKGGEYINE